MSLETMAVIVASEPGGPEVLVSAARPLPEVLPHEVRIKIQAAGVNGPDLVQRRGHYPPPEGASDLLGLEVAGEIVALGAAVTQWRVGDLVCALTNGGGYAEYVAVDAAHCLPIPKGVSVVDSAGLPEVFFTVWSNVFHPLGSAVTGKTLLVHGGAGGVGSAAIQLGAAMGMQVFATAHGDEDLAFCENLGATRAIDYRDEDFVATIREAGGADVILDIIGAPYLARNIKAARPDGRIIQLAFNQGAKVEINLMPLMLKRLVLTGATLRSRSAAFKAEIASGLRQYAWPLLESGAIKPVTFQALPLAEAGRAHVIMEAGDHRGKLLLTNS